MRRLMIVFLILMLTAAGVEAESLSWQDYSASTCLPLDNPLDPLYTIELGLVPSSDFEGYGSSSLLEFDGRWRDLLYYRDVLSGDIDLSFIFDTTIFIDSADIQLPDQVAKIAFDAGWTWRYVSGNALQLRVAPGIYSDIEEMSSDVLFSPVSIIFFKSFHDDMGGLLGVEVRPGFERVFFPLIGLDWEMHDHFRLSLRLPESSLTVHFNKNWSAHVGYEWSNMSYALREKGSYSREMITYEDSRYTFGLTYKISDELQFTGVVGQSFDRSVEFEKPDGGIPGKIDIERGTYVRVGIGGPF